MSEQPSISELRKLMAEIREDMEAFKAAVKPLQEKTHSFQSVKDAAYQEYIKKCSEIDKEKRRVDIQLSEYRLKLERAQQEFQRHESMLDQLISVQEAEKHLLTLENRWNALTEDAPWRQFIMKHQQDGSDKMVFYRKVGLFDVMGLGKTFTAIAACDKIRAATVDGDVWYEPKKDSIGRIIGQREFRSGTAGRRILYLCPAELVRNVEPEWKKWAPYRSPKILAKRTKLQREIILEAIADILEEGGDTLVILNYEAWRKDLKFLEQLISLEFDTVILDEAHSLKDRESIAYRGVEQILNGRNNMGERIVEPPRFVFPMTGTPFLNKPQELYSILTLIEPSIFPNSTWGERNFLSNYCDVVRDQHGYEIRPRKWRFRDGGMDSLARIISNRYIRRTLKSAGITLPKQEIQYHELDIDVDRYPAQAKAREQFRDYAKMVLSDEHSIVASIELEVRLRLRQIETWPAGIKLKDPDDKNHVLAEVNVYESQKMDYIISDDGEGLLTELCPDHRTVVFSQFNEPLEVMAKRAERAGLRAIVYNGNSSDEIVNEVKIDFDRGRCRENGREPKWDVVFATYKKGGQGVNFTDATQTIALDEEWNPGKGFGDGETDSEDHGQAGGRTRRIGQTEETGVHIVRMNDTVDAWIAKLNDMKKASGQTFEAGMTRQMMREALEKGEI